MTSASLAAVLLCAAAAAAFFAAAHAAETAHGDLVTKTCADMMTHDWGWSFDDDKFCESRLRLDKRSAAAKHPRDLALIAMDLVQRAAADADAKVAGVLRFGAGHRRNNSTKLILRHCRLDFAAVASTVPVCRAMVADYKKNPANDQQLAPNDYFDCARRLRRHADTCWLRITEAGKDVYKLVLKEIEEAYMRTELMDAMLEEMLGIVIKDHYPPP